MILKHLSRPPTQLLECPCSKTYTSKNLNILLQKMYQSFESAKSVPTCIARVDDEQHGCQIRRCLKIEYYWKRETLRVRCPCQKLHDNNCLEFHELCSDLFFLAKHRSRLFDPMINQDFSRTGFLHIRELQCEERPLWLCFYT